MDTSGTRPDNDYAARRRIAFSQGLLMDPVPQLGHIIGCRRRNFARLPELKDSSRCHGRMPGSLPVPGQ